MKFLPFMLGILLGMAALSSRAEAQNYPWCAYYGSPAATNCGFTTYQQCMAAISGNGGFCQVNNQYVSPAAGVRQRSYPH
jgi:hypothetical protein